MKMMQKAASGFLQYSQNQLLILWTLRSGFGPQPRAKSIWNLSWWCARREKSRWM